MAMKARVKVPKTAKKGEVFQIKTLITHVMESGRRKDSKGETIPRKIINKFECTFNGKPVFSADINPSVSANPFIAFYCKAEASGEFVFTWTEDGGATHSETGALTVS
ncbi:MAG: thiosulfate oxidation carrier complex protein SoxZ [Magnetospiraceae bacterium]